MKETITVPGEPPCPRPNKWRVWWWFDNDEASAKGNTFVYRYLRNPLQNFRWYVVGVVDRDHTVTADAPAMANIWSEAGPGFPTSGWKNATVAGRPYWSYCKPKRADGSDSFVFQFGWQPRGGLSGRCTKIGDLFR